MSERLNAGQRLSRGVAIIASVEPESCADIHSETLYYGTSDERYTIEQEAELFRLGWRKSEGSWAFYT